MGRGGRHQHLCSSGGHCHFAPAEQARCDRPMQPEGCHVHEAAPQQPQAVPPLPARRELDVKPPCHRAGQLGCRHRARRRDTTPREHETAEMARLPPRLQRLQPSTHQPIPLERRHRRVHAHAHHPVKHTTRQPLRGRLQRRVLAPAAQVARHLPLLPVGSDSPRNRGGVVGESPPPQRRRLARVRPERHRAPPPGRDGLRLAPARHRRYDGDGRPPPRHSLPCRGGRAPFDGERAPAVERGRLASPQHTVQQLPLPRVPLQRHDRRARLPARPAAQRRRRARTHRRRVRRELTPRRHGGRLPTRLPPRRRATPGKCHPVPVAPPSHRRAHRLAAPAANGRREPRARRAARDGDAAPAAQSRRLASPQHASHQAALAPVPLQRHDRRARLPAGPAAQRRRRARAHRRRVRRELTPRRHRRRGARHGPARRGAPGEPPPSVEARPSLEAATARATRRGRPHAAQQRRPLPPLHARYQPRRPRRRHAAAGPAKQRAPGA